MSYEGLTGKNEGRNAATCKECRYWLGLQDSSGNWVDWCRLNGSGFKADGFCSKWRRKHDRED